jgi:hypothetical protein
MSPRRHIEAVPDDDGDDEPPRRVRARGVPALSTSFSAAIVLLLLAGLVIAVILVVRQL